MAELARVIAPAITPKIMFASGTKGCAGGKSGTIPLTAFDTPANVAAGCGLTIYAGDETSPGLCAGFGKTQPENKSAGATKQIATKARNPSCIFFINFR